MDHEILLLILHDTNVVFDRLKKYTSYLLKITPATEKGLSEIHSTILHIRTEEDGMSFFSDNLWFCSNINIIYFELLMHGIDYIDH